MYESYKGIIPLSSVRKTRNGRIGRTCTSALARYLGTTWVQIAAIAGAATRTKTTNTRHACRFTFPTSKGPVRLRCNKQERQSFSDHLFGDSGANAKTSLLRSPDLGQTWILRVCPDETVSRYSMTNQVTPPGAIPIGISTLYSRSSRYFLFFSRCSRILAVLVSPV